MDDPYRRTYYRIRYPFSERPRLIVDNNIYEVIDCGPQGLRYAVRGNPLPPLGTALTGRICFRRGAEVTITGVVVRVNPKEVALYFPSGEIPFSILLAEQRYLHTHYPMWS